LDKYGIYRGYEERLDKDDGKGSRAVPSRTSFGCQSAFIEKYPEYGRTRRFFFGLVKVRHWGYRCELTNPLIDLMMADLPHTLFNPKDTRAEEIANDPSIELNMQAAMRKKERMEREQREKEGKLTLDDVFNESAE
jgi:hypothetical protein